MPKMLGYLNTKIKGSSGHVGQSLFGRMGNKLSVSNMTKIKRTIK